MSRQTLQVLFLSLFVLSSLKSISTSTPSFHEVLKSASYMVNIFYSSQIQRESKVQSGICYARFTPGAKAEYALAQVLAVTLPKYDTRFSQGVNAFWTFQIRIARVNPKSKWHLYAKSLPLGIQTIRVRQPTKWQSERVTGWSSVSSRKVIVY